MTTIPPDGYPCNITPEDSETAQWVPAFVDAASLAAAVKPVGRQRQEHVVGGATTQDVFGLLPEIRPDFELRQVGADQRRARNHSARDIAPIRAVGAIGHGRR